MFNLRILKLFFVLVLFGIALVIVFLLFFLDNSTHLRDIGAQEEVNKKLLSGSVYIDRLEHLNLMCRHFNHSEPDDFNTLIENRYLLDHIVVDTKHQLLYCYVPKVACTNWKRLFMILTGATNTTNVLSIPATKAHNRLSLLTLSNFTYTEIKYLLSTYTKFLFVRHPFERLLSAFRNKLEYKYNRSMYFHNRFGKYIVKNYRTKPNNASNGDDVTFAEFTAYLAKSESEVFNEHWKPIHHLCEPCRIKYHFIGKYETLLSDSNFILKSIGVSDVRFPFNVKTASTSNKLKKYFSMLSPSRIKDLYNIYEIDFKLFQYNLQDLLGYEVG
ncbi:unnamed protein product [Nezara viridula]|uniref:Carbohydrate sulfotransferase n=1 Tax=Nezara viridula TaxID=85310 RepID=A0A9P0E9X5_NEZVI|nr:unnamed protein product [Nezara viridula]